MVTVVVEPVAGVDVVTCRSFRCQLHNHNTFGFMKCWDLIKWGQKAIDCLGLTALSAHLVYRLVKRLTII